MAKADVLARVKQDLAAGHTYPATQRLRTLLASYPDDLEIYSLLASVYRQTGNLAETGRWGFLTAEVRDAELAAFARVHPNPWSRLRLVTWRGNPADLATDAIRERLAALLAETEQAGPPATWVGAHRAPDRGHGASLPCLFTIVTLLVVGSLVAIGAYRIMEWVIH